MGRAPPSWHRPSRQRTIQIWSAESDKSGWVIDIANFFVIKNLEFGLETFTMSWTHVGSSSEIIVLTKYPWFKSSACFSLTVGLVAGDFESKMNFGPSVVGCETQAKKRKPMKKPTHHYQPTHGSTKSLRASYWTSSIITPNATKECWWDRIIIISSILIFLHANMQKNQQRNILWHDASHMRCVTCRRQRFRILRQ